MSRIPEDFLYDLLPAFYRELDRPLGEPLRALMSTLQGEYAEIHDNVEDLYRNWFIETSDRWVVPYLGELLGVEGLDGGQRDLPTARRRVADALALRRRKGTRVAVERGVAIASGWPVQLRPQSDPGEVAVFEARVWRLRAFPVVAGDAGRAGSGLFTFHPLGVDGQLFQQPRAPQLSASPIREDDLPVPLSSKTLALEIEALRRGEPPATHFLEPPAAFTIFDPATGEPIPPAALEIADLEGPVPVVHGDDQISASGHRESHPILAFVDPEHGRLAFPGDVPPEASVRVSYSYGSSADLGGGPYRTESSSILDGDIWRGVLSQREGRFPAGLGRFSNAAAALRAWRASGHRRAVLWLEGDSTFHLENGHLEIALESGEDFAIEAEPGTRPAVVGDLRLSATGRGARARLEGFWLGGAVQVYGAIDLELRHVTLQPGARSVGSLVVGRAVGSTDSGVVASPRVRLTGCITGPVYDLSGACRLTVEDSIIDGAGGPALLAASKTPRFTATLARTTVLGSSGVGVLELAEDTLFTAPVTVHRTDVGEVRYCYLPTGSRVPTTSHCVTGDGGEEAVASGPAFTSRRYGDPGYAQLGAGTPEEILVGSSRGSEMGGFELLRNPDRRQAMLEALEEFMPWGTSARLVLAT